VAALLARKGRPLPLSQLETKEALIADYAELLPKMARDEWRRVRGEQEIIVRYEPERAMATLPELLNRPGDKERLVALVRQLLADERLQPSAEQLAMVERLGDALEVTRAGGAAPAPARKPARPAHTVER
jgi:hypothetical protein